MKDQISPERQAVLDMLRVAGTPLPPKDVAHRTGMSPGGVRRLVKSMSDDGQLMRIEATSGFLYAPFGNAISPDGNVTDDGVTDVGDGDGADVTEAVTASSRAVTVEDDLNGEQVEIPVNRPDSPPQFEGMGVYDPHLGGTIPYWVMRMRKGDPNWRDYQRRSQYKRLR